MSEDKIIRQDKLPEYDYHNETYDDWTGNLIFCRECADYYKDELE